MPPRKGSGKGRRDEEGDAAEAHSRAIQRVLKRMRIGGWRRRDNFVDVGTSVSEGVACGGGEGAASGAGASAQGQRVSEGGTGTQAQREVEGFAASSFQSTGQNFSEASVEMEGCVDEWEGDMDAQQGQDMDAQESHAQAQGNAAAPSLSDYMAATARCMKLSAGNMIPTLHVSRHCPC